MTQYISTTNELAIRSAIDDVPILKLVIDYIIKFALIYCLLHGRCVLELTKFVERTI